MGIFKKLKDRGEVWHYLCENDHEWESRQSPRGTYCYGKRGQTKCPICKSPVCIGRVYRDGIKTEMGAIHRDFKRKL